MTTAEQSLVGKVAIITGASSGIGRAISLQLARAGAHCALAARRKEALKEVADEIAQSHRQPLVIPTDVTDETQLENLVRSVVDHFGGLHIVVNNAGIYHKMLVEDLTKEKLEASLAINLVAPMLLTKLALPHLKREPGSAVINIASISGLHGFITGSAYCASKFGIMGFSESLFEEVREFGIKVCAICPGYVNTEMLANLSLDTKKMIQPEDIAQTVVNVLQLPPQTCPTQIVIRPQYSPYKP